MTSWQSHKATGIQFFKAANYQEAIAAFTSALASTPPPSSRESAAIHSNISASHLHLSSPLSAVTAAEACVLCDKSWAKGHVRLAEAYAAAGKSNDACNAAQKALAIDKGNEQARGILMKELRKRNMGGAGVSNAAPDASNAAPNASNAAPDASNAAPGNAAPVEPVSPVDGGVVVVSFVDRVKAWWIALPETTKMAIVGVVACVATAVLLPYLTGQSQSLEHGGREETGGARGSKGGGDAYANIRDKYNQPRGMGGGNGDDYSSSSYASSSHDTSSHDSYSSRPPPASFMSSLKSVFTSDSGSLSIIGVGAGLLICKVTGVSPWQALMMFNMMNGRGDLPPILTSKYSLTQLLLPLPANHPSPSHLLDYAYIPPNTYTPSDRPFASGSNGRVYRATAADGTNVILKQMLLTDPPIGDAARREIHFGSSLPPHPALVTYIEHFKNADETEVWLVFGDAGDSLRNFLYTAAKTPDETVIYMPSEMWKQMRNLAADKTFTVIKSSEKSVTLTAPTTPPPPPPPPPPSSAATDLLQKILFQVLSAAAHLHSNGVIHRDIKPSNIFCTLPDLDAVDCVLGDLSSGISPFSLNNLYKHEPASHLQETLQYTPPEYHLNPSNPPPYSPSFDSWSIGVTALEMLLGTPDVFSIDSRTEALLRAQLKKTHTPEPDIETALLLASFADYCIFDPKGATESGWLSDGDPLGEMSMVANSCGLEDFKRALLQRDSTQLGFNSPSSTRLLMLIWQLLSWDPKSRLTPEEALKHNYFAAATPVPSHTHRHDVAHPDVTFTCPVCGRSYVSHESCQTHVKGRKHGQFCEHEWEGGADFECLSSHFLMPIDDESGYCDNQGRRSVIEDFHSIEFNERGKFYGVFDGHNGNLAAKYVAANLFDSIADGSIEEGFRRVNEGFLLEEEDDISGSTATVVFLPKEGPIIIANVGDSRAVLCTQGSLVRQLTVDHWPGVPAERRRIEELGGWVEERGGVDRVNGELAVSRSFGDRSLGDLVSCVPHVARVQAGEGEYIIMGSDGLWDVVGNDDACGLVGEGRERGGDWQDAAERLTREAYARGSKDNIGVSIVKLTEKESDDGEELRKLLEGGAGKATRKMKKLGSVIEQH